jgi:tellurite resistance protein
VATLFGLALEIDVKKKRGAEAERAGDGRAEPGDSEAPRGLTAKLIELEDGDVARRIGRKLLEDSVVKNIVPVLGVGIAARWNYVATRKVAAAARKYIRYRCALQHALAKLDLSAVADPAVLVEGAWLIATVDGDAEHEEVMAVAAIVDSLPEDARKSLELDRTLGDDEEHWFEQLGRVPASTHGRLLDVLYLVAATDRELQASERRFLRRVGKALGREIDFARIECICEHLAHGEDLPQGFLEARA